MNDTFYLVPPQASTMAPHVDAIFWSLFGVSAFFTILIWLFILYFGIKYRRRPDRQKKENVQPSMGMELTWTLIPFAIMVFFFIWGAKVYIWAANPPKNALQVQVVGKQWMWKLEHSDGRREINALHVPVGQPIRLSMISQDVIHDFFIPAFRIKMDVVPGRYSTAWFQATAPGTYHIFCSQYCGTKHHAMIGEVVALEPAQYALWAAHSLGQSSPAEEGQKLFSYLGCVACHMAGAGQRGPVLKGLYGGNVLLNDGRTVVASDDYIRESILDPAAKIVKGFQPIMPSFRGRVKEEEILQLIAFIKSLGKAK